jgi:hypothetical protein
MHGGKRGGAGRKTINIDLAEMEKLCGLQCTDEEMAAWFGISPRTIERRRKQSNFLVRGFTRFGIRRLGV